MTWQECMAQRRVALCIPWNGEMIPLIYWYGILAAAGIFIGAWVASKYLENEGKDPELIWDALLWILIPGLIGSRLWYVLSEVLGGSTAYSLSDPLTIINPRQGGMNIFGSLVFGLIALMIFIRKKKLDGWLMFDATLLGLMLGQGIGRLGNFINIELYGPPTNSSWFGMIVPAANRLQDYMMLPAETRFHPTMLYEMAFLLLTFGGIYYLYRRNTTHFIHGMISGMYFVLGGFGRFMLEVLGLRPDQPTLPAYDISYSTILAVASVLIGLIIILDRLNYIKLPGIARPKSFEEREAAFKSITRDRERRMREQEKEKARQERRKMRHEQVSASTPPSDGADEE